MRVIHLVCTPETYAVGVARVGQKDQIIAYGTMSQLLTFDFGKPLHSLILCGSLHGIEQEMLNYFKIN